MKKFLTWYAAILAAIMGVPSLVMALSAMSIMSDGFTPFGMAFALAAAAFFTMLLAVGIIVFWPAVIVLVIGVIICLIKNA